MEDGDVVQEGAEGDADHIRGRDSVLDAQGPLVQDHQGARGNDEEDGDEAAGGSRDLAHNVREHDVVVHRVAHHLPPLGVLPETDVVPLERMGDAPPVGFLPVPEEETRRHLLPHPIPADLVEAQSVPVALWTPKRVWSAPKKDPTGSIVIETYPPDVVDPFEDLIDLSQARGHGRPLPAYRRR